MKFNSSNLSDYFSWKVTQVTYRECGSIELWTELLENIDNRMYSFEDDEEFQEYLHAHKLEGWEAPFGIKENTHYKEKSA